MNEYGIGVELTGSVVRSSTATAISQIEAPVDLAPSVVVVDGALVGGTEAAAAAAATPANVVYDVVGQFLVDRLWFVGGMMLTPDDCLRALLAGCISDARQSSGRSASALTVSVPPGWDDTAVQRAQAIVGMLGVPLWLVTLGMPVATAAADAASRLRERGPELGAGDLPPLPPGTPLFRPPTMPPSTAPVPIRRVRRVRRRWVGWVAWLLVVIGIPVIVVLLVRAGREPDETRSDPSPTEPEITAASIPGSPTSAPTLPPLTLGYLSAGDPAREAAVSAAVATIASSTDSFPSGAFVVVQPIAAGVPALSETVTGLLRQGVSALVTDAISPALADVVTAARAAGLPVCVIGDGTPAAGITGPGVVFGDESRCTSFLALAGLSARSLTPARMMAATATLVGEGGLECTTFEQCAAYVAADQPISFQPDGGPVRPAPDA